MPQDRTAQAAPPRARGPLTTARALRTALEHVSRALATPSLDGLVASEAFLGEVLAPLPPAGPLDPLERMALQDEIDRAREALARCRRLGRSLQDVARAAVEGGGPGAAHGYETARFGRAATGRAVDARA